MGEPPSVGCLDTLHARRRFALRQVLAPHRALFMTGPQLGGRPEIEVDSASWAAWLTDPATRSFSFRGSSGRYTARKEHRSRGGEYWVAYRKRGGKLHKAYLGKAQDLTLARLTDVAAALIGHDDEI